MIKFFILIFTFLSISLSLTSCSKSNNLLQVHFIDIGQGDATLLEYNNINLLIDSGPNSSEEKLLKYLELNNINKIDYLIATHPHEDHIGNMDAILKNIEVENFLAPKSIYETEDFYNMLKEIKNNNLKIDILRKGSNQITIDSNIDIEILSPSKENYENTNNFSPIIKLTHQNNSFLFTGDAEIEAEREVMNLNIDIDVLKVGHHGSSSSSSTEFLNATTPKISVISCGIQNQFSHPHKQTLESLNDINSKIYRTDEDGTILLISDGLKISKKNKH